MNDTDTRTPLERALAQAELTMAGESSYARIREALYALSTEVRAILAQAMTRDQFDESYDRAYTELDEREIPRQARKDALLLAAGTGRALALGHVNTVVTYDRASGYTVRDVTEADMPPSSYKAGQGEPHGS